MKELEWLQNLLDKLAHNPKLESPDEPDNDVETIPGKPLSRLISELLPEEITAIHNRVLAWRKMWPQGEPKNKRLPPWRVFIYTQDVAAYYKRSMRTSQRIMQNTRFVLEKEKNGRVTVAEFCIVNNENEQIVRDFLHRLDAEFGTPFGDTYP